MKITSSILYIFTSWYFVVSLLFGNVVSSDTKWSLKLKSSIIQNKNINLHQIVQKISQDVGLHSFEQIGQLKGHYLFKIDNKKYGEVYKKLKLHKHIDWHKPEIPLKRVKRYPESTKFQDPLFTEQWHLKNLYGLDCNVTGVWDKNITGRGVVVAIVDDGVEWRHPDLIDNYCPEGSFDLNSNDNDPSPNFDKKDKNKHGTRCAGEVAAVPNSVCGVGIAYGSRFSGIRVIDGPTTDATEAIAFNKHMDVNDVYSCSWGPEDDGKTVDGPHALGNAALQHGVLAGRNGFGSVFVVASGNGGDEEDNCNYDGYANSIYTITIGAISGNGEVPFYSEKCTSMLACTVSSGKGKSIVTTDWTYENNNCTKEFTGTSAATPLVAGMIALMLEARPCLTWRDIQHIIALTAQKSFKGQMLGGNDFVKNNAEFYHSDTHGFGLLDAWKLVNAARVWESVPWLTSYTLTNKTYRNSVIPLGKKNALFFKIIAGKSETDNHLLNSLEHILLSVTIKHSNRGKLSFSITCPSGTKSIIPGRKRDKSSEGFTNWVFSSVKCWGEKPYGEYGIEIMDKRSGKDTAGRLVDFKLTLYGSQMKTEDYTARRSIIDNSMSGNYLLPNYTLNCSLGVPLEFDITTAIPDRTIKLIVMLSCFFLVWAIYYSIEMTFCNAEDKEKTVEDLSSPTLSASTTTELSAISLNRPDATYGGINNIETFNIQQFENLEISNTEQININEIEPLDTSILHDSQNIEEKSSEELTASKK